MTYIVAMKIKRSVFGTFRRKGTLTKGIVNQASEIIIGIDLGTTNTSFAYYINNSLKTLENYEGKRTTPSYIYFQEKGKITVGEYAKSANYRPGHGIYAIKRLIGRKFDDPKVQENLTYLSYNVEDVGNEPIIVIKHGPNETTRQTPVELSAIILAKIRKDVQSKLGKGQGRKAVITVPAYFNMSQRQATLEAATEAGFIVLKLLNEPTAAALSFFVHTNVQYAVGDYFLVYDLGGGTFDVAVLKKEKHNIKILGVDGDSNLGGEDFDNIIMKYLCDYLKTKHFYNPEKDRRNLRRLRNECEDAKKQLSVQEKVEIALTGFVTNQEITIGLTRQKFEELADELFEKTFKIIDNCLKNCQLSKLNIKKVILAGGSTRIPKIRKMISDYFSCECDNEGANPDECVAEGAALQAAMLSANPNQKVEAIKITDIVPISLGVQSYPNLMSFCIKRHSQIPISVKKVYNTTKSNETTINIDVYEGERADVRKNRHLGTLVIEDLTLAPPGQCQITVTMAIDQSGILKVTAEEKHKSNTKQLSVACIRDQRSDAEVENEVKSAETYKQQDEEFMKFAKLKTYLVSFCERIKYKIEQKNLLGAHRELHRYCDLTLTEADGMEIDEELKMNRLLEMVQERCKPFIKQYSIDMPKFK